MSLRMSREELAHLLKSNPGLRVAERPLDRAEMPVAGSLRPGVSVQPPLPTAAQHPGGSEARHIELGWLAELLAAPPFRGRLEAEEELSWRVATELRRLSLAGKLHAVWRMVPTEHKAGGRGGMMAQAKISAMGGIPGCPDYGFWWRDGSGLIELKVEQTQGVISFLGGVARARKGRRTYQSPRQRDFELWAKQEGVRHAVCRRVREVTDTLGAWGVLDE